MKIFCSSLVDILESIWEKWMVQFGEFWNLSFGQGILHSEVRKFVLRVGLLCTNKIWRMK